MKYYHNKRKLLNHYGEVKDKSIGIGASSIVLLIKNKKSKKLYAVKRFIKNTNVKRLSSEFCISSILDHVNIVRTFDLVFDKKKQYCIVMEYCSGGDLFSIIQNEQLSKNDINKYFRELLNGLQYLHEIGIAHRDIKLENLLVSNDTLKITDFGESVIYKQHNTYYPSYGLCGSTSYIAPEIFTHSKLGYDPSKVDVWSAGIVLFCLNFNTLPFYTAQSTDSNYSMYAKNYSAQNYLQFNTIDSSLKYMLYNMLNPNPLKRFTIQDILDFI